MLFICMTSTNKTENIRNLDRLEKLLMEMAQGNKDALCFFYEEAKAPVYGFALSILRNRQDAEDILQETFLQVYAAAKDYTPKGKPMAWVLTVTKNLCLMRLREYKKESGLSLEEAVPESRAENPQSTEEKIVLEAAMTVLSDCERQIVMLNAVSGFKYREISGFLNLPLPTVLSKYHRAMGKLKKQLSEVD